MLIVLDKLNNQASLTFDTEKQMIEFISNAYFTLMRNPSCYAQNILFKNHKFCQAYIMSINHMTVKIVFRDYTEINECG